MNAEDNARIIRLHIPELVVTNMGDSQILQCDCGWSVDTLLEDYRDHYATHVAEALKKPHPDDVVRWDAAYAQRDEYDPPSRCPICGERRTVYCNGDGFGYCRDHYPAGAL